MHATVALAARPAHRVISEIDHPRRRASDHTNLRKAEIENFRKEIAEGIDRARSARGWNLDQLSAALPPPEGRETRDPRQVRRWLDADPRERPQFDVLAACADEAFRVELIKQLIPIFRLSQRVRVNTVITLETEL